tara:strand:- start:24203 stop:25324 length:1122 start_codon:yes stop_codon:yes gene_type:complete
MKDKLAENLQGLRSRLVSHYIDVVPYKAVDDPTKIAAAANIDSSSIIKLDANENPFGSTDAVTKLFAESSNVSIYPDAEQTVLREALSRYTNIDKNRIVAGAGSDELIDLVTRLFVSPGDSIMISSPTFGMYSFSASVAGARVIDVPRNHDDFSLDVAGILDLIKDAKLMFIASPNNPTGNTTDNADLRTILDTGIPLVVDEAYVEFSEGDSSSLLEEYSNLMILRTFSKWAGLAGLRVGYGLFPEDIASLLMRVKPPYSVSTLAQAAATKALDNVEQSDEQLRIIVSERSKMFSSLKAMADLKVYPSQGNFLLVEFVDRNAEQIKANLLKRGISVRYFDDSVLKDYLRISIGLPKDNIKLLKELENLMQEAK